MAIKFKTKYATIGNVLYQPKSDKPSLTDESFKQECDIDFIISNFVQKGIEPPEHQIDYGKQFTSKDFENAMYTVAECKSAFEELSSSDKERFGNSVTNFLDFVSNPANLKECYEKGYINPDSVELCDVYPERFNYNTSSTNSNIVSQAGSTTSNVGEVPAETAGSENPTQTT